MAERRYPAYNPDVLGRAATFNPARASMPVMPSSMGMGYNPVYPGDIHSYPTAPSRHDNGPIRYHHSAAPHPRGQGSPVYAATDDIPPRSSRPPRDVVPTVTRPHRSSTIDSTSHRPIIITTTGQNVRSHGHNSVARGRSRSPARDEYRPVGSSIRAPRRPSRSGSMSRHPPAPPYSPIFASEDDYSSRLRGPEVVPASGRADPYRSSRPTVVYPSNPRHATVDIGDQYGYTKPGDLAQYDLEHPKHTRHRRHESFDHYARPNIYYNPERRGFNIETHRTHDSTAGAAPKSSETRGGPPPTTWGLDRLNRNSTMYEPVSVPPAAPVPPPANRPDLALSTPRERRGSNRLPRPVSLYQEAPPRPSRDNAIHWPRDDERPSRKERDHDQGLYVDDHVRDRGFGIRTDLIPEADDRRDRRERARKEYVDSAHRPEDDLDRDWDRIERVEARELDDGKEQRRRQPRGVNDEEKEGGAARERDVEPEPGKRLKDNLKAGLGIAASAVGLGPVVNKHGKSEGGEDREVSRERPDKDRKGKERSRRELEDKGAPVFSSDDDDDEVEIISARASDRYRPREKAYISRGHRDRDRGREQDRIDPAEPPLDAAASHSHSRERNGRNVEGTAADDGPTKKTSRDVSHSDDGDADKSRKGGRLPSFNPNDTEDLNDIKEKLASLNVHDKEDQDGERVMVVDPRPDPATRSERRERSVSSKRDPVDRARDIILSASEKKAVRVVSPPPYDREGPDTKPKKGILKAPRPKFPEDPNPIREGVAPHKNDDKLKEVPSGARWTRISRKVVNPDALEVGKERYEVRDDFVIVLRVLSREEIEAYAAATAVLRERKRKELDKSKQGSDEEEDDDDDTRRRRRRYRDRGDPEDEERNEENDKGGRHRRHRRHDEEEEYGDEGEHRRHEHHHRRHREREGGS